MTMTWKDGPHLTAATGRLSFKWPTVRTAVYWLQERGNLGNPDNTPVWVSPLRVSEASVKQVELYGQAVRMLTDWRKTALNPPIKVGDSTGFPGIFIWRRWVCHVHSHMLKDSFGMAHKHTPSFVYSAPDMKTVSLFFSEGQCLFSWCHDPNTDWAWEEVFR